jgi:hypothetical protein
MWSIPSLEVKSGNHLEPERYQQARVDTLGKDWQTGLLHERVTVSVMRLDGPVWS